MVSEKSLASEKQSFNYFTPLTQVMRILQENCLNTKQMLSQQTIKNRRRCMQPLNSVKFHQQFAATKSLLN